MKVALVCVALVARGRARGAGARRRRSGERLPDHAAGVLPVRREVLAAARRAAPRGRERGEEAGLPDQVALIPNSYDLGSVTSLWRKPRLYARFLGEEDATFFKQRLLIVMPNGFGFYTGRSSVTQRVRGARGNPDRPGDNGLVRAALAGVQKLAAASGVTLVRTKGTTSPKRRGTRPPVHRARRSRGSCACGAAATRATA